MISKASFTYLSSIGLVYLLIASVYAESLSLSLNPTIPFEDKKYELLRPPHCGYSNVRHPKIVGGVPAQLGAWPWMAVLGFENETSPLSWDCGGSLITSRHVLTAAHCAVDGSLKYVRLGELDLASDTEGAHPITVTLDTKILNPNYVYGKYIGDVAVLKLSKDITFTNAIHPVCLPIDEPLKSRDFVGTHPFVTGWGLMLYNGAQSAALMELQVEVLNTSICAKNYNKYGSAVIDHRVICAGYEEGKKDACKGDSGGPLVIPVNNTYYEIGVVSFGHGCAWPGYPGVYSRVTEFLPFIKSALT